MDMDLQGTPELDDRRRKLRYRAWHRGTREMDLVLGRFADAELPAMTVADLAAFEALMEAPDPDLFSWIVGQVPVPEQADSPMFHRLVAFHRTGEGMAKP
jgi:antitoxin CptB